MNDRERLLFRDQVFITNIQKAFGYSKDEAEEVFKNAKELSYPKREGKYDPRPERVNSVDVFKYLGLDRNESRKAYMDEMILMSGFIRKDTSNE